MMESCLQGSVSVQTAEGGDFVKKLGWKYAAAFLLALCMMVPGAGAKAEGPMQELGPVTAYSSEVGALAGEASLLGGGSLTAIAPQLKKENAVNWIDRIESSDCGASFYAQLKEACMENGILVTSHDGNGQIRMEYSNHTVEEAYGIALAVYDAFLRDHPEIFWLSGMSSWGASYSGRSGAILFYITDHTYGDEYTTAEKIRADIALRDGRVQEILRKMPDVADTDVEKVLYFNDTLTKTNEYNTLVSAGQLGPASAHSCLSALMGNGGEQGPVCEGYAKAFKVLCDQVGIHCVLVDGDTPRNEDGTLQLTPSGGTYAGHMWNNVCVEGQWYGMDVTWNDPTGGSGKVSGHESNDWTLLGRTAFETKKDHNRVHQVENCLNIKDGVDEKQANGSPAGRHDRVKFTNGMILFEHDYLEGSTYTYNNKVHHTRSKGSLSILENHSWGTYKINLQAGTVTNRCTACNHDVTFSINDVFDFHREQNSVMVSGKLFDGGKNPDAVIVAAYSHDGKMLAVGEASGQRLNIKNSTISVQGSELLGEIGSFSAEIPLQGAGAADRFKVFFLIGSNPVSQATDPYAA